MRTGESQENIVKLSGIREKKLRALSPYGPVKAGLITTQRTNEDQVLTELLNSLERKIVELSIKSCEVLNIFLSDTEHLARRTGSSSNTDTTDSI